jgi:hypothetical protein
MTKPQDPSTKHLLPALIREREKELKAREKRLQVAPENMRMCNATMLDTTYRTGDGEVLQHPRPASLHAFTLPSFGDRT